MHLGDNLTFYLYVYPVIFNMLTILSSVFGNVWSILHSSLLFFYSLVVGFMAHVVGSYYIIRYSICRNPWSNFGHELLLFYLRQSVKTPPGGGRS